MQTVWNVLTIRCTRKLLKRLGAEAVIDPPSQGTVAEVAAKGYEASSCGDWTVGVLMVGARNGLVYVIDVVRMQGSPLEVERLKATTAHTDAQLSNRLAVTLLQQEPGAAGKA